MLSYSAIDCCCSGLALSANGKAGVHLVMDVEVAQRTFRCRALSTNAMHICTIVPEGLSNKESSSFCYDILMMCHEVQVDSRH